MRRRPLKQIAGDACRALGLILLGALLLSVYLSETQQADAWLKTLNPLFVGLIGALNLVWSLLQPAADPTNRYEPSPRWSGVSVVLATGMTGAFAYGIGFTGSGTFWGVGAIVIATIIAAVAMWLFASSHAAEIGEARFAPDPAD